MVWILEEAAEGDLIFGFGLSVEAGFYFGEVAVQTAQLPDGWVMVVGEVEAVEFLECVPGGFEPGVGRPADAPDA